MLRNIQNQCCSESDDVKQHLTKMLKLREELAATGKVVEDINFTSMITNSLPSSYDHVISSAYSAAKAVKAKIDTDTIISIIQEEYSRRRITNGSPPHSTALFINPQKSSSLKESNQRWMKKPGVCTNEKCRNRHNHEFKDCRSKGGRLHGQDPPPSYSQSKGQCGGRGRGKG